MVGLALLLALPNGTKARARADAPDLKLIGFSEDGRYFAFEQFSDGADLGEVHAAIDVIDRETGRSAEGFPFGLLGMQKGGESPLKVGQHEIRADEALPTEKQLADLRRRLRAAVRSRLEGLTITEDFQRLAGDPITDRRPARRAIDFTLHGTLPGPMPDIDRVYRLTTRISPNDYATCVQDMRPQDHRIELTLAVLTAAKGSANAHSHAAIAWPHGDDECASSAIVTDVVRPGGAAGGSHVVAIVLGTSWGSFTESARYFASFIRVPGLR
jgi:hypothetical protein